jgi:hypothetical protein
MRWLVEVTSLGKAEKDSLYVDADSWQKALQVARSLRGESEPLSGFSIELLDEGCRAVDPVSRVSYEVHRAPEDGRPAPRPQTAPPKPATHETPAGAGSGPPRPSQAAAPAHVAPAAAAAPKAAAAPPAQGIASTQPLAPPHVAPAANEAPPPAQELGSTQRLAPHQAAPTPQAAGAPAQGLGSTQPLAGRPGITPAQAATPAQGTGSTQPLAPHPAPVAPAAGSPTGASPQAEVRPRSHGPTPPRPAISPSATMMIGSPAPPLAAPVATPARVAEGASTSIPKAAVASSLPAQIVFKREQDATEALPLTYREYVFVVPPGSTEMAAGTLVHSQFDLVRAAIDRLPAGKLVNLAVFDMAFQGKPAIPPLATLTWKDWRGAAFVSFPRQPGRAPVPIPTAPITLPPVPIAAPPEAAHPSRPPIAAVPAPSGAWGAAAAAPGAQVAPSFPPPPLFSTTADAPPLNPAPVVPFPVAQVPFFAPPGHDAQPRPMGRVHGEDLIADLFESMHDLHFARDTIDGGDFCLALAMEKLASLAGLVQLYDINTREFLVTNTRGEGTAGLLLRRFPETDGLLAAAMRKRHAVVIGDAVASEAATNERYLSIGGARSLIIAPVMQSGRFLGAIELLNPIDGQPFTESDGNAVTYIAEQLAAFVAERGIVTDPERIGGRQRQ